MSAPTLEHAPSSVEHLDQLSQADLLERREKYDAEYYAYDVELDAILNKFEESNDPELAILEQLENDRMSDENSNEDRSTYSYIVEHGEGLLSPDLISIVKKLHDLEKAEEVTTAELDKQFAPALMQYARDEAMDVFSNLDYVAAGKFEKGKSPDLPDSDGIQLRWNEQTLPHPDEVVTKLHDIAYDEHANLNYRYAEQMVDEIERCKQILERWGVGTAQPIPQTPHDWKELGRAEQLNERYRNYHSEVSAIAAEGKPQLPLHEWAVHLPEGEVAKYYEHLASIDIGKELERVGISGIELLPIEFSDNDVRQYIRNHIPAIALEGINDIVFRKTSEQEKSAIRDSKLFDGKGVLAGHHSHDVAENSGEIVIHVEAIQSFYDKTIGKFPDEDVERWTQIEMLDTLAHELGHALHHTLPVSILHEWDQTADLEDADVSTYVSEMKKTENKHSFMEDFADSFKLYVNMSFELKNKAPKRYETMQAIVTKLKPAA